MKLNMNDNVKVKLTDVGIQEMKKQHDEHNDYLITNGGEPYGVFQINKDEEGYTKFQMWKLMNTFGHMMHNGSKIPFDMDILLDVD